MGKQKISLSGQLADMDLKLLRVYKAVAECGGIAAAEGELNIAASTISNYLADLEQRLDMRLCLRGRKGFSLTDQGKVVYSAIQELLVAIEQFQGRIRGSQERLVGNLHLGIAENVFGELGSRVNDSLAAFTRQAPQVYIDLQMLAAEDVVRSVLDERLAVGISYVENADAGLELIPLGGERMYLYCGQQHHLYSRLDSDLSVDELERQKFVGTPRLKQGLELRSQSEAWHFQAYAPHLEGRSRLIQSGSFVGFLPEAYVSAMGLHKQLRQLLPEHFCYLSNFYAMTRKNTYVNPVVEKFLETMAL